MKNGMKQIIDDYSPILDGVEVQELIEEVKDKPKSTSKAN